MRWDDVQSHWREHTTFFSPTWENQWDCWDGYHNVLIFISQTFSLHSLTCVSIYFERNDTLWHLTPCGLDWKRGSSPRWQHHKGFICCEVVLLIMWGLRFATLLPVYNHIKDFEEQNLMDLLECTRLRINQTIFWCVAWRKDLQWMIYLLGRQAARAVYHESQLFSS